MYIWRSDRLTLTGFTGSIKVVQVLRQKKGIEIGQIELASGRMVRMFISIIVLGSLV